MQDVRVVTELPADVAALLGETDHDRACAARRVLILHLLRAGELSQGGAATLLGVTRADVLDLMAEHDIHSGPLTIDEHRRDVEQAVRFLSNRTS